MNMKKAIKSLVLAIAVGAMTGCATATPIQETKVTDQYDFDYMVQSTSINIVQVFDDGKSTFFQLAPDARVPAIFADTGKGSNSPTWKCSGHISRSLSRQSVSCSK